jgi:hypothetical protein
VIYLHIYIYLTVYLSIYLSIFVVNFQIILGDSRVNLEEQRRSEFYNQQWVGEAVFHYMTAKNQRKLQELLGVNAPPVLTHGQPQQQYQANVTQGQTPNPIQQQQQRY